MSGSFDRRGLPAGHIDTPAGEGTTNIAYGGPDGRSLYITDASTGSVLVAEAPEPGHPLYSHRFG